MRGGGGSFSLGLCFEASAISKTWNINKRNSPWMGQAATIISILNMKCVRTSKENINMFFDSCLSNCDFKIGQVCFQFLANIKTVDLVVNWINVLGSITKLNVCSRYYYMHIMVINPIGAHTLYLVKKPRIPRYFQRIPTTENVFR